MKIAYTIALILSPAFYFPVNSQTSIKENISDDNIAVTKAKKIIVDSKNAVYPQSSNNDFPKTISISYETTLTDGVRRGNLNTDLHDKIQISSEWSNDRSILTRLQILNRSLYKNSVSSVVDGKPFNAVFDFGDESYQINDIKWNAWIMTFPLVLDSSIYFPLEFRYMGVAEAPDGKADVIEAISENKITYQLLFDQKTRFLIMVNKSQLNKQNKPVKRTYLLSDYKEENGLVYAHKIIAQMNNEVAEETTIKKVKINPEFRTNLFEIKDK